MKPIKISEPSDINEKIFGIDLGTTNSLIALVNKSGNVKIFKDEKGRDMLPSVISYEEDTLKTGYDVCSHPIYSIKRLMGKNLKEIEKENINFEIDDKNEKIIRIKLSKERYLTPIEISAEILKALCYRVKKSIGIKVKKTVITVPAYFDDSARNATKCAAKLAGIEVIRLINEPTAAALSYSLRKKNNNGIYAVYDLGGGTFDISILKLHQKVFQVLAVGGDTKLGGDDFDYLVGSIVLSKYNKEQESLNNNKEHCCNNIDDFIKKLIFNELRTTKEYLSKNISGIFEFNVNGKLFKCKINKYEFEKKITPLVNKTINIVVRTINDVGLKVNDIKGVILVGGSTRIPLIHKSLIKLFGNKKILNDIDPDKAIVTGAALQGNYLTSKSRDKSILLDVLPLSLGIETMGGVVEKIILRNTPLPTSEIKEFTTYIDGQTSMKIHICQGEREMIKDNKSLAQFEFKNIPPLPAGSVRVEIEFTVNVDGILTVTAREKTTYIEQTVEINPGLGLNEVDIQNMINQSINNFDEDIKARSLAEAKINGNKLIKFIEKNNSSSSKILESLLQNLKKNLEENDLNKINNAIAKLENFSCQNE